MSVRPHNSVVPAAALVACVAVAFACATGPSAERRYSRDELDRALAEGPLRTDGKAEKTRARSDDGTASADEESGRDDLGDDTLARDERARSSGRVTEIATGTAELGLLVGEYPLDAAKPILDGDTIRVRGLDATMRLLGVDTEETFKHEKERRLYERGWADYVRTLRGDSKRPVKMATPVGDEAKKWAEKFFAKSKTVRVERDHPGEVRDFYGRYLAYVYGRIDGEWVNYNVEVVRAGYSPYFAKYGKSRRFHDDFVRAIREALAAKRGIWDPAKEHYPDYDERLKWWDARGEAVDDFERRSGDKADWIQLTRVDALERIEQHLDRYVHVFGLVGEIVPPSTEKAPTVVRLAKTRTRDLPVVFFDPKVFAESGIGKSKGEYVEINGRVTKYKDRLQLVVANASQVRLHGTNDSGEADEEVPAASDADVKDVLVRDGEEVPVDSSELPPVRPDDTPPPDGAR